MTKKIKILMNKKMKIFFYTNNRNLNIGSYRLWVEQLSKSLKKLKIKSKIVSNQKDLTGSDVIIFGKDIKKDEIHKIKKTLDSKIIIGAINPPINSSYPVDFVVTGSIEEKYSLLNYKNIFLYPLIEFNQYLKFKSFRNKKTLNVFTHGNHTHLKSLFNFGFVSAMKKFKMYLKDMNKELKLNLLLDKLPDTYSNNLKNNGIDFKFIKYNHKKIQDVLSKQDIAIISSSKYERFDTNENKLIKYFKKQSIFFEDISITFKNKNNFGRLFLCLQNKIPTIADITPSNLSLYDYQKENILFFNNSNQILDNLKKLSSIKNRKIIALKAFQYVKKFDNQKFFSNKLIKFLRNIKKDKNLISNF